MSVRLAGVTSPGRATPGPGVAQSASQSLSPQTAACAVRRVFVDCTSTWRYDPNTGIERVVRNIVNSLKSAAEIWQVAGIPVAFDPANGFVALEGLPQAACPAVRTANPAVTLRSRIRDFAEVLGVRPWLRAAREFGGQIRQAATWGRRRLMGRGVDFGPGDVLLLLDRSWGTDTAWNEIRRAQSRGALVGVVVYDLIPIEHPEFIEASLRLPFRNWWQTIRQTADFVVTISNSVAADVTRKMHSSPTTHLERTFPVGAFRLGAHLDGAVPGTAIRDELRDLMDAPNQGGVYLMVGTVTVRKGHQLVLKAFERLWADGQNIRLVIAGKNGCIGEELSEQLRNHSRRGDLLFWFDDLNDGELAYCLRHAAALITASLAEGFNLPIVEALSQGCPVFASDLPVHREVGGEFADYFPAGDPAALARLVVGREQVSRRELKHRLDRFRWPDWNESCRSLLEVVLKLAGETQRRLPGRGESQPASRRHEQVARAA